MTGRVSGLPPQTGAAIQRIAKCSEHVIIAPMLVWFGMLALTAYLPVATGAPMPVAVTNAGQERAARQLASAVVKELKHDPRFLFVDRAESGTLVIAMPAGVGWERRLGWTEISYQARLTFPGGTSKVIAGKCYNWNLGVCARQIADAAASPSGR